VPAYSLLSSTEPKLLVSPAQVSMAYPICMCIFARKRQQLWLVPGARETPTRFGDSKPVKEHLFHFTDLQPGTEYHYVIDNRMGLTFSTPPLAKTGTLVTFAVASDFHYGGSDANSDERTQILRNISEDPNVNLFFYERRHCGLGHG